MAGPWSESHYLIEPALGVAFALIPGAASTSLIATLRPEYLSSRDPALLNTPGHMVVSKLDHYSEVVASGLPVVAFVRHPWSRLMSSLAAVERTSADETAKLADHVETVASDDALDIHFKPQEAYLEGLPIAFVGSVEHMDDDWRRLETVLGQRLPALQRVNERAHPTWDQTSYDWTRLDARYAADKTRSEQVRPLVVETFRYASVAELQAQPQWDAVEAKNADQITLTRDGMRYDWPNIGANCSDHQIRPGFLRFPAQQRVWCEFVVTFSPNYDVKAQGARGCAAERKLATLAQFGQAGRWNVPQMQGHRWVLGAPPDSGVYAVSATPKPSDLWDGRPHTFRVDADVAGRLRFWVDGVLQDDRAVTCSHSQIDMFAAGLNMNQGPDRDGVTETWHSIVVHDTDPGWT